MSKITRHISTLCFLYLPDYRCLRSWECSKETSHKNIEKLSSAQKEALLGNHIWNRGTVWAPSVLMRLRSESISNTKKIEKDNKKEDEQKEFGLF